MKRVSLSLLDEHCIQYRRTESPIFRINSIPHRVMAYKILDDGFPKLRLQLSNQPTPFIYSVMREVIDNQSMFIIRGYCEGLTKEHKLPFITSADDHYVNIFYTINANSNGGGLTSLESKVAIESIAIGNNCLDFAMKCLIEAYKDDADFRILRNQTMIFRRIPNYEA